MASTRSRRLAAFELGKGSPHRGIARESGADHWPRHTSKRGDGTPAAGEGNGTPPPFQPVGDRGGRSLRLNALKPTERGVGVPSSRSLATTSHEAT